MKPELGEVNTKMRQYQNLKRKRKKKKHKEMLHSTVPESILAKEYK